MLMVNQVTGDYVVHHPTMGLYPNKVKKLLEKFQKYEIMQIPREENSHADTLANIASTIDYSFRRTIHFEYLTVPSTHKPELEVIVFIDTRENWIDKIIDYIRDRKSLEDRNFAIKLVQKALRYTVIRGMLYRCSYSGLHPLSITLNLGLQILSDIHSRVCGNHAGRRLLAQKALTASYY